MKIVACRAGIEFQQVLWFGIIRHFALYLNPRLFIFILVLRGFLRAEESRRRCGNRKKAQPYKQVLHQEMNSTYRSLTREARTTAAIGVAGTGYATWSMSMLKGAS